MAKNPAAVFDVPEHKRTEFETLMRIHFVPFNVLCSLLILVIGVIVVDMLAVQERLSLGGAAVLNTLIMYWAFTVEHDAIHRSAARNQTLNDWLGRVGLFFTFPQVSLGVFRWAHVQHHRFTNDPRDPDCWLHGPWWQMPIRLLLIDVGYLVFILRKGDAAGMRQLRGTLLPAALTIGLVLTLTYLGYGKEVLFLWFIPSRITLMLIGFAFFWLPHVKNDVASEQDLTLASSVRLGYEWLFTPLLQFHNYHMIHHLFPSMPSSRHLEAWSLFKPEFEQRNLQIQYGFAIHPVVKNGTAAGGVL